jgi:hypothetical protein
MAGFGTAGSMLAGGAVLFVLASAIVAFQGWPRIATQGSPAAIQVSATPAPPSLVSRRLRAVGSPPPTAGAVGALRAGVRAAASPAATHRVKTGVRKATGTAGHTVSSSGGQVGSAVGGPVGRTVTKVSITAGNAVSKLGSPVGG